MLPIGINRHRMGKPSKNRRRKPRPQRRRLPKIFSMSNHRHPTDPAQHLRRPISRPIIHRNHAKPLRHNLTENLSHRPSIIKCRRNHHSPNFRLGCHALARPEMVTFAQWRHGGRGHVFAG
jgi:hypothetical protein